MDRSIDILNNACNDLIDEPRLINEKSFMMHIYDPIMDKQPEFNNYMDYQCEDQTSYYAVSSKTREVPINNLVKELFTLADQGNQVSTSVLQKLTVIDIQELFDELEDEKKSTYKYLSIFG